MEPATDSKCQSDRLVWVASGFGLYRSVSGFIAGAVILAGSVKFWLDHDENSSDLNEILPDLVESGLNLDEISSYLVRSDWFEVNFRWRTPVFVCFRQRTPNIFGSFWLYTQVELLGFWERKPPIDPQTSGFVGGDPPPTVGVVGSGSFRFGFGRVAQVSRVPGWVGQSYLLVCEQCVGPRKKMQNANYKGLANAR